MPAGRWPLSMRRTRRRRCVTRPATRRASRRSDMGRRTGRQTEGPTRQRQPSRFHDGRPPGRAHRRRAHRLVTNRDEPAICRGESARRPRLTHPSSRWPRRCPRPIGRGTRNRRRPTRGRAIPTLASRRAHCTPLTATQPRVRPCHAKSWLMLLPATTTTSCRGPFALRKGVCSLTGILTRALRVRGWVECWFAAAACNPGVVHAYSDDGVVADAEFSVQQSLQQSRWRLDGLSWHRQGTGHLSVWIATPSD